jgi:ribosomal-protein-alanine N-acetyltransferase
MRNDSGRALARTAMPADERSPACTEPILRPLEPSDAAAIGEIARLSSGAPQWPEESYTRLHDLGFRGWVALAEGGCAGFLVARIAADEAEILNIAVAPAYRRRRYATRLMSAALQEFRVKGIYRVFLEVRESSRGAVALYASLGFRAAGRRASYYENPNEDALCMTLDL